MSEAIFAKSIDTNNRAQMISFLKNHFRYYTMNSWNCNTSYANCVKLYNLRIPDELFDTALSLVSGEIDNMEIYTDMIKNCFDDFNQKTGYAAGFNGRSSGYVVLYDTEYKNGQYHVTMKGLDMDEDFIDFTDEELKDRVTVVTEFDKLCDNLRSTLLYVLTNYSVAEKERRTITTVKVLEPVNKLE